MGIVHFFMKLSLFKTTNYFWLSYDLSIVMFTAYYRMPRQTEIALIFKIQIYKDF